ncbi:MAG TPA: sulfite exporter TauE/SafE family protein, partial [Candidatus Limnocylindrales bacterium]|nr:sulfite exporter TauE/SafE family protein [Candidatus Limnocylindrales bacterium]
MPRRLLRATAIAGLLAIVPAVALAHPLGNFTVNHYAGITVTPEAIELDVVIDMAEIPTFQERLRIDADEDGDVTDAEAAAAAPGECAAVAGALSLRVAGSSAALSSRTASISFPSGLGGLSTMRLECAYVATIAPLGDGTTIEFEDRSHAERIGWREIVVVGRGAIVDAGDLPSASISARLTDYPEDLIAQPLDVRSATIVASPGAIVPVAPVGPGTGVAPVGAAAVPGGVAAADVPDIFRSVDLTPVVLLVSLLTALALGAQHALTPGHGKTLMAAYLVGTRGRPLHAIGLGLAVAVSHTIGILILAAIVVGAQGLLPADLVVRTLPVLAAATIVAIGGWMLVAEVRRRTAPREAAAFERDPRHDAADRHGDQDESHAHAHAHSHAHARAHAHVELAHSHGGLRHSHAPAAASTVTWRSLGALGLAGGLIPSTSALFILLGAIVAGRPAFGFVLVVAFGLGMALVMAGVGLAIVYARDRVGRLAARPAVARVAGLAPLGAAVVVVAVGLFLTAQALVGPP